MGTCWTAPVGIGKGERVGENGREDFDVEVYS